ncbi:MAG: hypothetical protein HW384_1800 [Dehalococcoidia bacterium]|nr:hypothetical protein [Dehalococcoidia bacterium]
MAAIHELPLGLLPHGDQYPSSNHHQTSYHNLVGHLLQLLQEKVRPQNSAPSDETSTAGARLRDV